MNDLPSRRFDAGHLLPELLLIVFLALVSIDATAAVTYLTAPAPTGLVQRSDGLRMIGKTFAANDPRFSSTSSVKALGATIAIPASMTANALRAAKLASGAMRLATPIGLAASVLDWALPLTPTATGWQVNTDPVGQIYTSGPYPATCADPTRNVDQMLTDCNGFAGSYYWPPACWINYTTEGTNYYLNVHLPEGYTAYGSDLFTRCYLTAAPAPSSRPANDADFEALGNKQMTSAAIYDYPWLDGVPVDNPVLTPTVQDIGTTTNPDGSQSTTRVKITPAATASDPMRIAVEVTVVPAGTPLPDPATSTAPATDPNPQLNPCETNPNTAGCAELGTPDDVPINKRSEVMSITPVNVSMPGMCPASKVVATPFGSITIGYDAACQFAGYIRPVVMVMGIFFASMIFVGGLRNG